MVGQGSLAKQGAEKMITLNDVEFAHLLAKDAKAQARGVR